MLRERWKLQARLGVSQPHASNPNSEAEGVESDAAEDLAAAPSAPARALMPPSDQAGEFNLAGPAPARRVAGVERAPNAQAAGTARGTLPAGMRSNVSPHVVVAPVGRFDVVGPLEVTLRDTHSVVLLSGPAGVGKTDFGSWVAQRRSRREHAWQPLTGESWLAGGAPLSAAPEEHPRAPTDKLGPFFISLRGFHTPGAASLRLLRQLGCMPAADAAVSETDAAELLHATLRAELPDVEDAPLSATSCLFVLDNCDELLAPHTAAATWAWALRIAGVAPGVRVVLISRTPSPPPLTPKATHVMLQPLSVDGVRKWFSNAEAAMPEAGYGLVQSLSAEIAEQLTRACGGLPGVIAPLVHAFRCGLLRPLGIAALVQALAGDVPGGAARALEAHGAPPAVLQLPQELQHLEAEVQALAALAPPPLFPAFSCKDAHVALGCATQEDADGLMFQLCQYGVVQPLKREEHGLEAYKPKHEQRIFRMCGLRVALSRGSDPWFQAVARLQHTDEAAAEGPSISELLLPSPSHGDFSSLELPDVGALQPPSQGGDDFFPFASAARELLDQPSARHRAALMDVDELNAAVPPPEQERGTGRRGGGARANSPSLHSHRDGFADDLLGSWGGPPSYVQASSGGGGGGGTAAKARGGGAARNTQPSERRTKRAPGKSSAKTGAAAQPRRGARRTAA